MGRKILSQLEKIAYWLQRKYMGSKMTTELIGLHFAFFHPKDKSQFILALYRIRLARVLGKRTVLLTGCFDILHQEHRQFFNKAKEEGDILVVGLESDKRLRKLKGEGRPINSFKVRAKKIVRLNEVDSVLKLPEDFGRRMVRWRILQLIKPHLLAISSHDPLEKRKREECQKVGCKVKIVHQYNPKISTTKLLLDKKKIFF